MKYLKYSIGKLVTNQRIKDYVIKQVKFWEPIVYKNKIYIRTFEDNVYER